MKKLLLTLSVFALSVCAFAQGGERETIVTFRFVPGEDMFYIPWQGNDAQLNQLYALVDERREEIANGRIPLYVDSYSFSMKSVERNSELAFIRANRVKSELIIRKGLVEENFITKNHTASYTGSDGTVHKDMVVVTLHIPAKEEVQPETKPEPVKEEPVREEPVVVVELKPEPVVESKPEPEPVTPPLAAAQHNTFNIRTNLLYWLAGTPNLGVEYKPSQSVGILFNGAWTHWNLSDSQKQWRAFNINPELRYYMGGNKRFYMGIEGHYGQINYKFDDTGRQFDFIGGGLTTGYQLRLSEVFDLDFNIGFGYTRLNNDEEYIRANDVYVKQTQPETKNIWSPTQAGVILIWKL